MNKTEYEKLENGMSYMDVAKTAGGAGERLKNDQFQWKDEILMTQAYVITFKNDKLQSKKIIELRGHSTRDKNKASS